MEEKFAFPELSRRNFIKGSLVIGGVAAVSGLTACTSAPAEDPAKEPEAPKEYQDGKYVTRAMGMDNWINMVTVFKDKKIIDCQVLSDCELMGVGSFAIKRMPARIVEAQSVNVDTVGGATTSSRAILAAVTTAITDAGLNPDDFMAKPEAPKPTPAEKAVDADIVIMGAGNAGVVAAMRAIEKGKKVIMFEKREIPGGAMPMTYGGLSGYGSNLQKAYSLGGDNFQQEAYAEHAEYLKKKQSGQKAEYHHPDGIPYNMAMMKTGSGLIDWYHSMGVGFMSKSTTLAPGMYMGGPGIAMEFLVNRFVALGGELYFDTEVTELIQEGDAIVGVKAVGKDGNVWTVKAPAVLLASGGFGANADLLAEHYPQYAGQFINTHNGSTGEGMLMAQKAGAGIECMGRHLGAFLSAFTDKFELAFLHNTSPGIIVNQDGNNIGDILYPNHQKLSDALMHPDNKEFWYVMDEASAQTTRDSGNVYGFDTYKGMFEKDDMQHYASLEEAQEKTGLAGLVAAVESNNKCYLAGEPEYGRKKLPYIDTRDGVWIMHVVPTIYMTTGGLMIDTAARVLRADKTPIKGLYGAGDVCGSIEEKDGTGYNHGFFASMTYGYLAIETIVADMQ